MKYCINGWEESRSYFKSFGFSREEIERMENGDIIEREGNTFSIETEEADR